MATEPNKLYLRNVDETELWITNVTQNSEPVDWNHNGYDEGTRIGIGSNEYFYEIVCFDGYEFSVPPKMVKLQSGFMPGDYTVAETKEFTINETNTVATVNFDNTGEKGWALSDDWEVQTVQVEPEPEPEPVFISVNSLENNLNVEIIEVDTGEVYNIVGTGNVEIPKGIYNFNVTPDSGKIIVSLELENMGGFMPGVTENFTVSNDGKNATLENYDINSLDETREFIEIRGTIENESPENPTEPPEIIGTFNNLYLVDNTQLHEFKNHVIGSMLDTNSVSLEPFIINLLYIPVKIPSNYIGNVENIKIGKYRFSELGSEKINSDVIKIDLGSINVSEKYKNSYDFLNTNIYLHLPYTQRIEIPVEYVIGYSISIEYVINLYSGESTINVISSKANKVIHSEPFKIGLNVPLIRNQNEAILNTQNVNMNLYNNILNAFIEVVRNIPYDSGDTRIQEKGVIGDYQEFIRVDRPEIEVDSTLSEKNEIERLLNQGVYING